MSEQNFENSQLNSALRAAENRLENEPMLLEETCLVAGNFFEDPALQSVQQASRKLVQLGLVKPANKPTIDFYLVSLFSGSTNKRVCAAIWEANFGEPEPVN